MRVPLLLSLLLAACTGEPDPSELEPSVQIGTGDASFEPLADGDTVLIIEGPQGGFHVLGSARFTGVEGGDPDVLSDPQNPTYWFRVYDEGVRIDFAPQYTQGLDLAPEGEAFEELGRFVFLDITADEELVGHTLEITVDIEDVNGVALQDSVTVVAEASPFNG